MTTDDAAAVTAETGTEPTETAGAAPAPEDSAEPPVPTDAGPAATTTGGEAIAPSPAGEPEPAALSLGEQPHDPAHCDRAGQPHLGPCNEPAEPETAEARALRQAAIADAMTAEAMRAPAGETLPDIRAAGRLVRHGGIVLSPFTAPYRDCWASGEAECRALTAGWVTEAVRNVTAHLREWNAAGRPGDCDAGYVLQNACLYPPASPAVAAEAVA